MKRFTEKRGERNTIPLRKAVCGIDMPKWSIGRPNDLEMFLSGDAADRLAAYEESGLEPNEVELGPVCAGCDGKTADGKRTSRCPYPNVIEKCFEREKHIISLLEAEADGRVIVLPCKVGAKVRDINADYVFTVEKIETCVVYDKPALIFRCGNPGKSDYMAFYDFEIGKNIEILPEENANG